MNVVHQNIANLSKQLAGRALAGGNGNGAPGISNRNLRQFTSMLVAEAVGGAVSLGALYYSDQIAPETGKKIDRFVGSTVVRPLLPMVEWTDWLCSGLWQHGYEHRMKMPEKERVTEYARNIINYGGSFTAGIGAKVLTRDALNHAMGVPMKFKHGLMLTALDEGVLLGTIALMDTKLSKQTHKWQEGVSSLLQSALNVDKKRADELSTYIVVYEAPNILAFVATCLGIAAINRRAHL